MKSSMIATVAAGMVLNSAIASPVVDPRAASTPYAKQLAAIESSYSAGKMPLATAASSLGALLAAATPTAVPSSIQEYQSSLTSIFRDGTQYSNYLSVDLQMLAAGAGGSGGLQNYLPLGPVCPGINCDMNSNPAPKCNIYPRKQANDAPYSVSEADLRGAIYIPSGFSYGANGKQPVLLVPGSASYGGVNFQNNFNKILSATSYAETFWLNIPGAQLNDAQVNAEYAAYAMNYMQCQSGRTIAGLGWSQASLTFQWALKYWPSTRQNMTDVIAISPDYHGTIEANGLCALLPCDPAVTQQEYTSNFITTIRSNGGDSAYVPVTNVYSVFDDIVQPQSDPLASGSLMDARGVGVTNNEIQSECSGMPAGSVYFHEGVLYNPLAAALALDALQHDGPGQMSRINKTAVCEQFIASPLTLEDALFTEGLIPLAGYYLITYMPKSYTEPPIMAYAA